MDAEHQDGGPGIAGAGAVPRFERHVADGAQAGTRHVPAFDFDHRLAVQVVVELPARVPVAVQRGVRRDLDQVHQHVAPGGELLTQGGMQEVGHFRLALSRRHAGAGEEADGNAEHAGAHGR
jgi:hypothetical protein